MKCLELMSSDYRSQVLQENSYNEVTLHNDLLKMRLWVETQQHFPASVSEEPDPFFEAFLVGSKGSLPEAQKKMDNYFTYRTKIPHLFANRDPTDPVLLSSKDWLYMATLPKVTPEGSRLSMVFVCDIPAQQFDFLVFLRRFFTIIELRARAEGAFNGEWCVIDGLHMTASHLCRSRPGLIRNLLELLRYAIPARIKGIVFINSSGILEKFLNIFVKPFLKKKLADRIFIHTEGWKALHKYFVKEVLPKDYGGDEEKLKTLSEWWLEEADLQRDLFRGRLSHTVNESKRLQRSRS